MFFNHPNEPPEPRKPTAVYARVDQIEDDGDEGGTVLLDCIDRPWLEEHRGGPPLADPDAYEGDSPDHALSILAVDVLELRTAGMQMADGQWYELELGNPEEDVLIVDQYSALFSDPNPRGVIRITPVDDHLKAELSYLAGWGGARSSAVVDIQNALSIHQAIDAVAIYDVGQGAATALLSNGVPGIYFDFGGSVIGNWRSFPQHLYRFCFTASPPIVLSHWDWDHWSSAIRDRAALNATWILPLQTASGSLGPVHARFLAMLNQRAKVLWWDSALQQVPVSGTSARVVQSTGPGRNRNESGLALVVDRIPATHLSRSVLLPGDASFRYLEKQVGTQFDHVMVPHHGGKTDLMSLPTAHTVTRSHAIYSYGTANTFLHPNANTVKRYRQGWKRNTHTALRTSSGFGHVGINLTGINQLPPQPPCNGQCQLSIQHWF